MITLSRLRTIMLSLPFLFLLGCTSDQQSNQTSETFPRDNAHAPHLIEDCEGLLNAIENIHHELNQCTTDGDCRYFDDKLSPIDSETLTFVTINDCAPVKPLILGHQSRVSERREELLRLYQRASESCGHGQPPTNCSGFAPFQPTLPGPLCVVGRCKPSSI